MKNILLILTGLIIGAGGAWIYEIRDMKYESKSIITPTVKPKPLLKYTIDNLGKRVYKTEIVLDEVTASEAARLIQKFHFDSDGKRVSGVIHRPIGEGPFPVIVQFRGYAEGKDYYPGYGTEHAAEKYVKAGFITIAPDFLGYGDSASPSADVWEARFETYTTAANLLAAVSSWKLVNSNEIGLWGHSNGGQIALAALEITGKNYPTVLWAPMSLPFPYSILYFMDENGEGDRNLRQSLAAFETDYDSNLFNPLNYLDKINTDIQIHQGTNDVSVPDKFTDKLVDKLKSLDKNVKYYKYPADHNFLPIVNWNKVVERDIAFYLTQVAK